MLRQVPAGSLLVKPSPVYDGKQLAQLVYDVAEKGVARPFLVDPDLRVLSRELEAGACRMLDVEVPVIVIDVPALVEGAKVEEELTPTEAIVVGRLIEEHLRPAAEANSAAGRRRGINSRLGRPVDAYVEDGERVVLRKVASAALGMSVTTYSRVRDLVVAAEEDPEHFGDLLGLMEAQSPSAAHAILRRRQRELNPPVEPDPERKAKGSTVKVTAGRGPAQMVQSTLYSLVAAANLLDSMNAPEGLDEDQAQSWADDLQEVLRSLNRFRGRLIELTKEQRNGH